MAKELFDDYVKEKKLREPEEKKELAQTLKTFYGEAGKKGFVPGLQITDSRLPVMMTGQIFFSPDKPRFWPVK